MSSALDLDGSSKGTVLDGPCDWKEWISIIKKFATSHSLWEDRFFFSQLSQHFITLVSAQASDLIDLSSEEFRRLEFLHTQYRSKLQGYYGWLIPTTGWSDYSRESTGLGGISDQRIELLAPFFTLWYRDQVKALASLQQHIVKTIGNYYSTIAEEHDIAKQLALLQARVARTDWALEREVLQRYRSTLQSPDRTKIEAWVTQWQKVLTEAKQLGLLDVQDLRPTQDFLQAVSRINSPFTDYWVNKMEDDAAFGNPGWKTNFPDGIKISEIFERAHRVKTANNNKGAFGASFKSKEETKEKKEDSPRWNSTKNADGVPRCVCGKYHYFKECFYLIETKVEKKIKAILDSNPWAKKMTEAVKEAQREKTPNSSENTPVPLQPHQLPQLVLSRREGASRLDDSGHLKDHYEAMYWGTHKDLTYGASLVPITRITKSSLPADHRAYIRASINNGWKKLDEHYNKLGESPLFAAAVILHPRFGISWLGATWWWRDYKQTFPALSSFALDVFAIPAMATDCERQFSLAKLTLTSQRLAMRADTLEQVHSGELGRELSLGRRRKTLVYRPVNQINFGAKVDLIDL
ncbi:integrase core domain-containing protein [Hirsutella rhossiliensis]